jgi:hypothetical protein
MRNIGYLVKYIHNLLRNIGVSYFRKHNRMQVVESPVDDEGNSYLENISEEGGRIPTYEKVEDDVIESIRELWGDVRRFLDPKTDKFISHMISETASLVPRSPWGGFDEEEREVTDKATDEAHDMWEALVEDLFDVIENGVLRSTSPINYRRIRTVIVNHVKHKKLSTFIREQFVLFVLAAIRKEARKTHDGFKLEAIEAFFEGVEHEYQRKLEKMRVSSSAADDGDYMTPEEMVLALKSKKRKADSNLDDLERYVDHLMGDTSNDDGTGGYRNMVDRPYRVYNVAMRITKNLIEGNE